MSTVDPGFIVLYIVIALVWLLVWSTSLRTWGVSFYGNKRRRRRKIAARMILLSPLWPVSAAGWVVYWTVHVIRVASGREKDNW